MNEIFPAEPTVLAARLPDIPRWIYARSLLLSGDRWVELGRHRDAALVLDSRTAVLVGRPDPELLRATLPRHPSGPELLVDEDAIGAATATLVGWSVRPFVVHALPRAFTPEPSPPPGVVISAPLDPATLTGLPDETRADPSGAPAAAVRIIDGRPVAVCFVAEETEALWDVGVDTIESARRRRHASAAFVALAGVMAGQGRQPVWSAYEDYTPSMALAARLGFRPVARMAELTPPATRPR